MADSLNLDPAYPNIFRYLSMIAKKIEIQASKFANSQRCEFDISWQSPLN